MNDGFMNHSFEPFWPGRQWQATKPENNFAYSYYGNGVLDYDRREGWTVILRLYGPLQPFFDKTWPPSEIEEVK